MRVYFIKCPHVSSGLRKSYNKQLEVYSGEINKGWVYPDKMYQFNNKKGWVEKTPRLKEGRRIHSRNETPVEMLPKLVEMHEDTLYATLDLAATAKFLLIQRMTKAYEDEIEELRKLFKKNVPNVDKPLEKIREDYPEYFI